MGMARYNLLVNGLCKIIRIEWDNIFVLHTFTGVKARFSQLWRDPHCTTHRNSAYSFLCGWRDPRHDRLYQFTCVWRGGLVDDSDHLSKFCFSCPKNIQYVFFKAISIWIEKMIARHREVVCIDRPANAYIMKIY